MEEPNCCLQEMINTSRELIDEISWIFLGLDEDFVLRMNISEA